eukprot:3270104-Amphidinium_carterae.1
MAPHEVYATNCKGKLCSCPTPLSGDAICCCKGQNERSTGLSPERTFWALTLLHRCPPKKGNV